MLFLPDVWQPGYFLPILFVASLSYVLCIVTHNNIFLEISLLSFSDVLLYKRILKSKNICREKKEIDNKIRHM